MPQGEADQSRTAAPSGRQGRHSATSALAITLLTKSAPASADSWRCSYTLATKGNVCENAFSRALEWVWLFRLRA